MAPERARVAVAILALLLTGLSPVASAHNPALTVYEPAPLDGGLLVLGEDGTATLLEVNGTERWRTNVSAHLIQAPVVHDGTAATTGRDLDTLAPSVVAFDEQGVRWAIELPGDAPFSSVAAVEQGFAAFTSDGQGLVLAPDGRVLTEVELPIGPALPVIETPEGGWLAVDDEGVLVHVGPDGEEQARTRLGGRPTDLQLDDGTVYAAFIRTTSGAGIKAMGLDLQTRWVEDVDALRVGGTLAIAEDRIVYGTFDPDGATIVALTRPGDPLWTASAGNDTAAAVALADGRVYASVNSGVLAFDGEGQPLWQTPTSPRIEPPSVIDGLVLPSGAEDQLVALDGADGTVAWNWTDGVTQVPWTDEGLAAQAGQQDGSSEASDQGPDPTPLGALATLAAICLGAIARIRSRS